MTAEDKKEIQKIQRDMIDGLKKWDDYIHEQLMKPAPDEFAGLQCRYQNVKEKESAGRI